MDQSQDITMMCTLLVVLLFLSLGGGGWGYSRYGTLGGVGPIGLFLIIFVALWFTGNVHL